MSTTYNHISMKRGLNWNLNVYKEMHFLLENFFSCKASKFSYNHKKLYQPIET